MTRLIPPSKSLGYSDIFLDFLAGGDTARHLYRAAGVEEVAAALDRLNYDRDTMAAVLRSQNSSFGASEQALANIERLVDHRAVCVFAGQQACLFGGPLLIVLKALGVAKAAQCYERQLHRPVIPVFWIAGDDHDFDEVNHTWLLDRAGEPVRISYETGPQAELPIAEIRITDADELGRAREAMQSVLGDTDFTPALFELVAAAYHPQATFVEAFGRLMARLTAPFGLVLFCPGDATVKRHATSFFLDILDRQSELHRIIATTNQHIEGHGYHLQVQKKDNATHLFCNLDGRRPVMRDGDAYVIGERSYSEDEVRRLIEDGPERFSPDVLMRPVLQSLLFPVLAQKGGPSEIAYLAQIDPLFGLFGRAVPYYMARPSATLVEKRFENYMADYAITFEDLIGDIEDVVNRVLAGSFPENLQRSFENLKRDVAGRFQDFVRKTLEFDPSLRHVATQTYGKIDYLLKHFEGKVFAAHKRQSKQTRDRIYRVWHALYPNRALQERSLNVTYFLSRYGPDLLQFLYDRIDCEERSHQLIHLSEFEP